MLWKVTCNVALPHWIWFLNLRTICPKGNSEGKQCIIEKYITSEGKHSSVIILLCGLKALSTGLLLNIVFFFLLINFWIVRTETILCLGLCHPNITLLMGTSYFYFAVTSYKYLNIQKACCFCYFCVLVITLLTYELIYTLPRFVTLKCPESFNKKIQLHQLRGI